MSTNVGSIDLELLLNSNKFNKQLKNINSVANSASNSISSSLSKIGKAAIAAFSVKQIFDFGKECIELGSDLAEVQNVVDVSFSTMNEKVNQFAENAIEQFGLGQTVTKKYMGTFGAMANAFGFAEEEAYEMSKTLTGLAGDVASFYNMSSDEAFTKLKSVFTGETETLKDLGVVMTQSALDSYALANGFSKTTSAMTEQEKVALRYQFVMEQLSLANGDFARTSDSWANQTRVLSLRFNELKATLGQGFINLFTPIIKGINWLISKLQVLANAFKSFTEFLTGKKSESSSGSLGTTSDELDSISSSASDASDAISGIGSSAKQAAKDAKSLMSYDTANILKSTDSESASSGGTSSSAGGSIDFGADSLENAVESGTNALNPFIDKLKELAAIFKEGFNISLGNVDFTSILTSLSNIKNALIDIWTSPQVLNAANNWMNTVSYALGQTVGAVARIGLNVAEFFIGSIEGYLQQNTDRIKNFVSNIFNISSEDIALTGNLFQALGEISDIFKGHTAKQIGSDIIAMFVNPFMSVTEFVSKFAVDLKGILIQPIIDNVDGIKLALENTLKPIQDITSVFSEAITYIGDKANEIYDNSIGPFLESIKNGLSDTFGKFLDVYNEYVAPFLEYVSTGIQSLWTEHLQPLFDKVGGLLSSVISALQALWETILKPLIDWIIQNIIPAVVPVLESIWNTISSVFGSIADTIGGVIDVVKGLIDFIVGVFTGDWTKAWEGIKTIFSRRMGYNKTVLLKQFGIQ